MQRIDWPRPGSCVCAVLAIALLQSAPVIAQNVIDATSKIAAPPAPTMGLKRKVAIARFSNETQSGQSFLVDNSGDRIGKQAADILSARLTETGKFMMFERLDADDLSAEKMLAGLKEEGVAVDYLIVGSVSEFGRSTESDNGVFSRSKTQKAYAKVNVRLVDVSTGRILSATEGAGEATSEAKRTLGVGGSAGYDQSLTDKAISAAISQLTSNVVDTMTAKPWRSYLLSQQDGQYVMSGGASQGLRQGMRLYVYELGGLVKNPQTGAMISLPGRKVAEAQVNATVGEDEFNELSFVSVVSGALGKPLDSYYVSNE
jgi:curli biogenesis system outer membrane secretion channel CsgG